MSLAASRFEGGSWVRIGFLATYTAFAYGCVVVGWAALRLWRPDVRDAGPGGARKRWGAAVLAVVSVGALALPAIEFPDETLSGFRGLDALSVIMTVALAVVIVTAAFVTKLDDLRVPASVCLTGVLAGNLLIQRFTTRGTTVGYGLWCTTIVAAICLVTSLMGVRGGEDTRR